MKTCLIRNYCMIMFAWILMINTNGLLGCIIALLACIMLYVGENLIMNWRSVAVSFMTYLAVLIFISGSNIPLFFPGLYIFMFLVSINVAFSNEYLYYVNQRIINYIVAYVSVLVVSFSLIIFILPSTSYCIFNKVNLYLLLCLIFLPYYLCSIYCLIYKKIICKSCKFVHYY